MYVEHDKRLKDIDFDILHLSKKIPSRYQGLKVCDDIMTFDIETTSFFIDKNGQPVPYDYNNPGMLLQGKQKMERGGILYHWQFNIKDNHFTGRSWEDLLLFIKDLHKCCPARKFIYVHNLSFEFGWLPNIISFSEEEDIVLAREAHRVMSAYSKQYNTEFKCSYYLTQKSLDKWGQQLGLPKSKELIYNKIRTPLTPITPEELHYCFVDVDIVAAGIKKFKEKYKHVYNIPLTQTGEVRRELRKVYKNEFDFYETCRKLQPSSYRIMRWMLSAFYGGCVLVNPTFKDERICGPFIFKDLSSSYPWVLISERYPLTRFVKVRKKSLFKKYMEDPDKTYMIDFYAEDVQTRTPCLFLSSSKLTETDEVKTMNGRVATAKRFRVVLCKPDFELFRKCYKADIDINYIKISDLQYLPDNFRRFVIEKYGEKTKLKHSDPEIYQNSKQIINALFGINCQKLITDTICFDTDHQLEDGTPAPWYVDPLTEDNFAEALHHVLYNENGTAKKLYTATQIGIYCTAYARQNLWYGVLGEDDEGNYNNVDDVIYTDTDSVKMLRSAEAEEVFERYNKIVLNKHKEIAAQLGIQLEDLSPLDDEGVSRPIGIFADDGSDCKGFKALGAKKYCYRDGHYKLKLTVAGVPKDAVVCLNDDINNFKDGMIFKAADLYAAGLKQKLAPLYIADQRPVQFPDGYKSIEKYAICMVPVDYTLSKSYDMYSTPEDFIKILYGNRNIPQLFRYT